MLTVERKDLRRPYKKHKTAFHLELSFLSVFIFFHQPNTSLVFVVIHLGGLNLGIVLLLQLTYCVRPFNFLNLGTLCNCFFLRCRQLYCHLIVDPNQVILHFEPENINFQDFKCQFMAFGSGFERFEVQKNLQTFQMGSYTPKKSFICCLFWAPPMVHTHSMVKSFQSASTKHLTC
jgi:hypothetical protein